MKQKYYLFYYLMIGTIFILGVLIIAWLGFEIIGPGGIPHGGCQPGAWERSESGFCGFVSFFFGPFVLGIYTVAWLFYSFGVPTDQVYVTVIAYIVGIIVTIPFYIVVGFIVAWLYRKFKNRHYELPRNTL